MNSSRGQVATTRSQRAPGLAVPTLVAALVCGGSVFAIAATGALALDSGVPTTVSVSRLDPLSAADPAATPIPTAPIATMSMPAVAGTAGTAREPDPPAAVALPREPIRPRPRTPIEASGDAPIEAPSQAPTEPPTEPPTEAPADAPVVAPTGVQYSVAVHGPGYDVPRGAVAVAAEPSVEFLGYGPTSSAPSPSVTPSATWVTDAR